MTAAHWISLAIRAYLGVGFLFALCFAAVGVQRLDPAARGSGWGMRILLLPGATALWPWLLVRWVRGLGPSAERNAHRDAVGPAR